jgi:hypothetical protein
MDCYNCKEKLIWNNDFTYEDFNVEGDGIVVVLSCTNQDCDVDIVNVYVNNDGFKSSNAELEKMFIAAFVKGCELGYITNRDEWEISGKYQFNQYLKNNKL